MKLSKEEKLQEIKSELGCLSRSLHNHLLLRNTNTYHSEWLDRILVDLESVITMEQTKKS